MAYDPNPKSFVARCKEFFGYKEGQTLQDFGRELRQLSAKDRAELTAEFEAIGLPVKPDSKLDAA